MIAVLVLLPLADVIPTFAGEGVITGRVSLTNRNGEVIFGDWVRVFLTSAPVDIPTVDLAAIDVPVERRARINTVHMAFFQNVQQKLPEPGYAIDNKLSRPDGTFAFHGIPAGHYYIVITFPTMIDGFKCAWQAPADVVAGNEVHVELNNGNMILPAF
jgi:hypothetical protein